MAERGDRFVFLVGAGRSGTTLVYKLLCLHPHAAYISNYDEWFLPAGRVAGMVAGNLDAKLAAWFGRKGNAYFVRRPILKRMFPTPVEGESIYRRCGMPLFPGRDYRPDERTIARMRRSFDAIRRGACGRLLISKRTSNNRRIPALEATFPGARYVHIIRDGREVADSLLRVEWWSRHRVWWDGRTAEQMERSGEDSLIIAARNWVYEMKELAWGLSTVDPCRVMELRYEDLLANPVDHLLRIFSFIGLDREDGCLEAAALLGLRSRPPSWRRRWSDAQLSGVMQEQGSLLTGLGYQ
ncbi:MAG: sulfotransferase [Gammaproteobacteria bacterium]|jgi:hypothetical protein|nr:sulfotransferase [Gammaproteobacteria bacterium]